MKTLLKTAGTGLALHGYGEDTPEPPDTYDDEMEMLDFLERNEKSRLDTPVDTGRASRSLFALQETSAPLQEHSTEWEHKPKKLSRGELEKLRDHLQAHAGEAKGQEWYEDHHDEAINTFSQQADHLLGRDDFDHARIERV